MGEALDRIRARRAGVTSSMSSGDSLRTGADVASFVDRQQEELTDLVRQIVESVRDTQAEAAKEEDDLARQFAEIQRRQGGVPYVTINLKRGF